MALNELKDLYLEQLRDLYSAESQILEALPEMVDAADDEKLKKALESHRKETEEQVRRLEKIFQAMDEEPGGEECEGMRGLLEEGEAMLEKDGAPEVLDAGIIAAAQRVEHYEIAGYGTARAYAEQLGEREAAKLLSTTLEEETAADDKLNEIAESTVNKKAQRAAVK